VRYLGCVIEETVLSLGDVVCFVFGEEDEFAKVVSKSSLVSFKTFLASVFAAMINIDADGFGELNSQSNRFDFSKGESFA
jgi:hypothetical protein